MFVINITYTKPLSEVDALLQAHRTFLGTCYEKGYFLASGPKVPRTGGIILSTLSDQAELEEILASDPFLQENVAEYQIIKFEPVMMHEKLQAIKF